MNKVLGFMIMYVVGFKGSGVYKGYCTQYFFTNTSKETLNKLRTFLKKEYGLDVGEFSKEGNILVAKTNDPDVEIAIKEISLTHYYS